MHGKKESQVKLDSGVHSIEDGCYVIYFTTGINQKEILHHIEAVKKSIGQEKYAFVLDFTHSHQGIEFDALKIWSSDQSINHRRKAEAYVVNSLTDQISIRQHLRLNTPPYEVSVFPIMEDAKNWLISRNNVDWSK